MSPSPPIPTQSKPPGCSCPTRVAHSSPAPCIPARMSPSRTRAPGLLRELHVLQAHRCGRLYALDLHGGACGESALSRILECSRWMITTLKPVISFLFTMHPLADKMSSVQPRCSGPRGLGARRPEAVVHRAVPVVQCLGVRSAQALQTACACRADWERKTTEGSRAAW